jgi:zinc transporter
VRHRERIALSRRNGISPRPLAPGNPLQYGEFAMTDTLAGGLICAYGFGSDGSIRELSLPVLGDLMRTPDGFLWAHLNISIWPMRTWIGDRGELPEIVREVLVSADDIRPRFERCGDGLVGTLSDVQHDFSGQSGDIGTLHVWFNRNMLITTRSHPLTAVDKLRLDIRNGFHPATTGELIGTLIDHLAESFHKVIEEMVDGLDEIEDAILAGISTDLRSQLGDLRRQVVSLRRQLLPQRRGRRTISMTCGKRVSGSRRLPRIWGRPKIARRCFRTSFPPNWRKRATATCSACRS